MRKSPILAPIATTMRKSPILAPIALGVLCLLRAVPVMCDRHAQPAAFPRTTVNFDYAWRYQAGSDRKYEQQCAHPEFNVSYADPSSPGQIWAGTLTSKELCCNECANHETCRAWDWNGQWCWLNENPTARKAAPGRWSGLMGPDWPQGSATHPPRSRLAFADASWAAVDAPHDYGRTRELSCQSTGRRRRGLDQDLPNAVNAVNLVNNCSGWYRKHFTLPTAWTGGATWVYFEGVHHYSFVWLNGKPLGQHLNGYLSFWHRLDTNGAKFGPGEAGVNVLAIAVNSDPGSGMYGYHGGGLTRHQWIIHTDSPAFIAPEEAWVHTTFDASSRITPSGATPADGLTATGVELVAEGAVLAAAGPVQDVWVTVEFTAGGAVVAKRTIGPLAVGAHGPANFTARAKPEGAVALWSVARPALHTARFTVHVGGAAAPAADAHNVTFGVRATRFDADHGFFLNRQHVKLRGFCDFGPFGAVGAATPDRVHLFRAQMLRSVGGNGWRMAHNPPAPQRLRIMDRVGMLALDENHYYGNHGTPYGIYSPETLNQTVRDMASLVKRDRSHPSVFVWNLCNEVMCKDDPATAAAMRAAALAYDTTRPITMNHIVDQALTYLDVQGMSHRAGAHMDSFHRDNPAKPIMSTEAANCKTERAVDTDFCPEPGHNGCIYNDELSACIGAATNYSDSREFNAGTFLWAGFDHGSGDSGASGLIADWAGIEKPLFWWFRSWWLSNISVADAGRPFLVGPGDTATGSTVYIVDSWTPPPAGKTNRSIHVYSNARSVRLWCNGELVGEAAVAFFGSANFSAVPFSPGNLTAEALDAAGTRLATHTVYTGGAAAQIRLSLDAPSPRSGTGSALVADGQDVALVRAELLDGTGQLVSPRDPSANTTITFKVTSGAGRILGTISGSPFDMPLADPGLDMTGAVFPAHYGMLRAFVQSTRVCIGSAADRALLAMIHTDAGRDGTARIVGGAGCGAARGTDEIDITATADGLSAATIRIPVSHDVADLPAGGPALPS